MSRKEENTHFRCINCLKNILPLDNGSYRNHCPFCLVSLHVDQEIGDRKSDCKGVMPPIFILYKKKKGWQIVHKCKKCGFEKANKVAENCTQPDDIEALIKVLARS